MKTTALSHTRENIRIGHGEFRSGAPFSRHVGGKSRGGSADSGQKIAFFGLGSSAAVAHDAMNKFFRFNVPVIYSDDIVLQRMSCMNCDDDDVVVIISHTGRTKSLVELAQLARENDAMVIALTSAGTPLAREATLAITLDVPEDTDIYMPMVSRLAQLTVIDVLATGFTLRRGAKFRDNLKRVKEALKESRFDKEPFVPSDNQ